MLHVPDSFGQSAAMPQIYKEFGIGDIFILEER